MKNACRSPWLTTLILFQIALAGLLVPDTYGGSLSENQLLAAFSGNAFSPGGRLPQFSAYNGLGHRESVVRGHPEIVIFSGCECQIDRIRDLIAPAAQRNEAITLIFLRRPGELNALSRKYSLPGRLLAIRDSESLSTLRFRKLPAIIHLSADGTILSVQQG